MRDGLAPRQTRPFFRTRIFRSHVLFGEKSFCCPATDNEYGTGSTGEGLIAECALLGSARLREAELGRVILLSDLFRNVLGEYPDRGTFGPRRTSRTRFARWHLDEPGTALASRYSTCPSRRPVRPSRVTDLTFNRFPVVEHPKP